MRGQACKTERIRLRIVSAPVCPAISELGIYYDSKGISEWILTEGEISVKHAARRGAAYKNLGFLL